MENSVKKIEIAKEFDNSIVKTNISRKERQNNLKTYIQNIFL